MTRARRTRAPRRLLAGLAGIALLGGVVLAPSVQATEASWSDAEAGAAPFAATTLQPPTITACNVGTLLNLGLVFTGVTIRWTSPYGAQNVQLSINDVLIPASNVTQSGTGPYVYEASLTANLLQSLLGGLLGSANTVEVVTVLPDVGWRSIAATRTLEVGGLLGLLGSNTCTAP